MSATPPCPACTAPDLKLVSKFKLECDYCGSTFTGKPVLCPACGWINTPGSNVCPDCGEPLDVISQVLSRKEVEGGPQWLQRVRSQAEAIKLEEEEASQRRYQALEEIDRRRKEAEFLENARQRERDKGIFFAVLVVFIIVIIVLLIFMILQGQSGV